MKKGRSKIRNEALAKAFFYMRLMEKWGSGIPRVVQEVCNDGLAIPVFEGEEVDLVVSIYRKEIGTVNNHDATKLTDNEKQVIDVIKKNPIITQQKLYEETGITIGTIKRILPK